MMNIVENKINKYINEYINKFRFRVVFFLRSVRYFIVYLFIHTAITIIPN